MWQSGNIWIRTLTLHHVLPATTAQEEAMDVVMPTLMQQPIQQQMHQLMNQWMHQPKKPRRPCRNVIVGDLMGYYQLFSATDERCVDGCSYTNEQAVEFCLQDGGVNGGSKTSLECK